MIIAILFNRVNQLLFKELKEIDLRRLDQAGNSLQMTYYVSVQDESILVRLMDILYTTFPEAL